MPTNGISFDTIPDSVTQRALAHNFSLEEKTRRTEMILNKDFYYGKQEQQLTLINEDVEPSTINLTRPVVGKRAGLLYRKKLVREFDGPSSSLAFLEAVYKENNIDMLMKHVDLLSELTGSVLLYPARTEDLTKYPSGVKILLYDSSQFSAVGKDHDPTEADAISLVKEITRLSRRSTPQNPQIERVLRQQVWTEGAVVTYNGLLSGGASLQNELIKSESNELGFLPFYNVRAEMVHDQYLGHAPGTSLRKLNEVVNQTLTHLLHIIKFQGFSPIAVTGYQSGEAICVHPGRYVSLPAGANATVLSTDPAIKEILDVLNDLQDKMFETSSVPKVAVVGGEGESGRELMVRFFPLMELFENKSVTFQMHELNLANLILRIAGFPPVEFLNINYPEDDLLPLSSDDDTLLQDIKLSLKTPVDELMRRDADLTEEEATALYLANLEFNRSTTNANQGSDSETDETGEDPANTEEDDPDSAGDEGEDEKETPRSQEQRG